MAGEFTDLSVTGEENMHVTTDQTKNIVILRGERFQVSLTWAQALNLGSLLVQKAEEPEAIALLGRSYCPSTERDRR